MKTLQLFSQILWWLHKAKWHRRAFYHISDKTAAIAVKEKEIMPDIFESWYDVLSDMHINVIFIGFEAWIIFILLALFYS